MMEQTLEMMRKRHAYFSSLIEERGIKTARQFYDELHDWFMLFGIELSMCNDHACGLCIEFEYSDYEQYIIEDQENGEVMVSPCVGWNDNYCCNSEIHIFEEDRL